MVVVVVPVVVVDPVVVPVVVVIDPVVEPVVVVDDVVLLVVELVLCLSVDADEMASTKQASTQSPHPTHLLASITTVVAYVTLSVAVV